MSTTLPTTASTSQTASVPAPHPHITLQTLIDMKRRREPIAMLTAYDFPTAKILAANGIEILLVGDSVATTVLGLDSTLGATMDLLVTLTGAVRRGAPNAFVMGDMPFASFPDVPTAVANAARFVKEAGADAVKLEADIRHAETITAMTAAGIVTCAHVGLLPQRAPQQGGYVAQGRTAAEAARIISEAEALVKAGAQLLLIEAVPDEVTAELQKRVTVPILGCGAGSSADGHVIVSYDLLGYTGRVARFVEKFADLPAVIGEAAQKYVEAVKGRTYPAARHMYRMKNEN